MKCKNNQPLTFCLKQCEKENGRANVIFDFEMRFIYFFEHNIKLNYSAYKRIFRLTIRLEGQI